MVLASPCGIPIPPAESWADDPDLAFQWRVMIWLWGKHVTPFTLVRLLGPFGRMLTKRALLQRLE